MARTDYLDRRHTLQLIAAAIALPVLRVVPVSAAHADVLEVAPGVFVHRGRHELISAANSGDIANPGFVIGRDAVAVIDTGGSPVVGDSLKTAIVAITDRPIRYVINTHMHPDHVFGNAAFDTPDVTFVGHHKLARGLTARAERYLAINGELLGPAALAGTRIITPSLEVADRTVIDLGGRTLELVARPTAHTDNDLTIKDSETGTLFMGDLIFSGHVPTIDGSIRGWIKLLDTIAAEAPVRVVPGHGPHALAWEQAERPMRRYLETVAGDVRDMIRKGLSLSEALETAGLSEKDNWVLFDDYHRRNVSAAYAELEWE